MLPISLIWKVRPVTFKAAACFKAPTAVFKKTMSEEGLWLISKVISLRYDFQSC